jgi:hypothetical protein
MRRLALARLRLAALLNEVLGHVSPEAFRTLTSSPALRHYFDRADKNWQA